MVYFLIFHDFSWPRDVRYPGEAWDAQCTDTCSAGLPVSLRTPCLARLSRHQYSIKCTLELSLRTRAFRGADEASDSGHASLA